MKNIRFLVLAMAVIFAMVVAGCAGQGEAGNQGGTGSDSTSGSPGAQQTDMPGTGDTGATGGADTTGSTGDDLDTGVGTGTDGQGTGPGSDSDLSGGTDSTGGVGSTGATTDTTGAGAGSTSGNFMGRWNFAMLEGCTVGAAGGVSGGASASGAMTGTTGTGATDTMTGTTGTTGTGTTGAMNAGDAQTMNCTVDGDSYLIELRSGDAGSAATLQEWAESDITGSAGGSAAGTDDAGEITETMVGNFDAVSVRLPDTTAQSDTAGVAGATCAARTYVWGMGNASGAGNSGNNQGAGNSDTNDNNAKNLLIVTVYQTSGDECNAEQVMADFLAGFRGGADSDMGSDTTGGADSDTGGTGGTTTP